MCFSLLNDEGLDFSKDIPPSSILRCGTQGIERIEMSMSFAECCLPSEERPARDAEGILGRLLPVLLPEIQYLRPPRNLLFVSHTPEAYRVLPHIQPSRCALEFVEIRHDSSIMKSAKCI